MKIDKIDLRSLRNHEHFQLHTEVVRLVQMCHAEQLRVEVLFDVYLHLYAQLDEALMKITRSSLTDDIHEADQRRDSIFRGLMDAARAALRHYRPEVREAAKRLKILFDTCGNVARLPLNEETSAVHNLLQALSGKYAADVTATNLTEWVAELEELNATVSILVGNRYDETAQRTTLVVKELRPQVDEAYRAMVVRLDALCEVEGGELYDGFARRLNAVLYKYATVLAQRLRRGADKKAG